MCPAVMHSVMLQVQKARLSALTHLFQKAGLKKAAAEQRCPNCLRSRIRDQYLISYASTADCLSDCRRDDTQLPQLLQPEQSCSQSSSAADSLQPGRSSADMSEGGHNAPAAAAAAPPASIAQHEAADSTAGTAADAVGTEPSSALPDASEALHQPPASGALPASSGKHRGAGTSPSQPRRSGRVGRPAGKLTDPEGGGLACRPRKAAPPQPRKRPKAQKSKLGPSGRSTHAPKASPGGVGKAAVPRPSKVKPGTYVPQLPVQLTCSESEAISHSTSLDYVDSQPSGSQQQVIDLAEDSEADEGTDEPRLRLAAAYTSASSPAPSRLHSAWQAARHPGPGLKPAAAAAVKQQPAFGGRPSVLDSMWPEEDSAPALAASVRQPLQHRCQLFSLCWQPSCCCIGASCICRPVSVLLCMVCC